LPESLPPFFLFFW